MTTRDAIKGTIDMAHLVTRSYLADLSDAELLVRPAPGANHIAWQLGHLIVSEHDMVRGSGAAMPALPEGFAAAHSREACTSDDPNQFCTKAEYLALLERMHAATRAALDATPDARLDEPAPEAMRSYCPTIGALFNLVGQHELMHAGQFAVVRRKLGKPVTI